MFRKQQVAREYICTKMAPGRMGQCDELDEQARGTSHKENKTHVVKHFFDSVIVHPHGVVMYQSKAAFHDEKQAGIRVTI
jgi:hypothetical protein